MVLKNWKMFKDCVIQQFTLYIFFWKEWFLSIIFSALKLLYLLHIILYVCPHTFSLGSSHVMWNTMMPSVKLLTEIPAMSRSQTVLVQYDENLPDGRWNIYYHVVLTFKEGVQNSLFDLGFLYHVGGCLGEDELSWPWFETIPIVFNDGDAVLQKHRTHRSELCLM